MRQENLKPLRLTAALFALACAGTQASPPDGDVARASNCVDFAWKATRVSGGVGLEDRRLYVFSTIETELTEASITIDNPSLSITKRRPSFKPKGAGTHDGRFVAGGRDGQAFSVLTGALRDPEFSQTSFEIPEGMGITPNVDFVAWDGEAFNLELDSVDFSTWAVRFNPDGSVRQPPTKYGRMLDASYEGYDLGYKISTNATSGVTYLFAATFLRDITGHTRDGKRLSWIPDEGVLTLPLYSGPPYTDKGIDPDGGATRPMVSADNQGGAWIGWKQSTNRAHSLLGIQHIASDGVLGPTAWFDKFGSMAHSLLARSS